MAISVECSNCGKTLKAKDEAAGKTAKCPSCGERIQIPAIEEVYDAEDDYGGASESNDDSASGVVVGNLKACPMCAEMIAATARKCKFCGEIFDAKLKKSRNKRSSLGGDEMGVGEWLVCLFCPGIGCIVGIVYAIQGKSNGGKMIGISLGMSVLYNLIGVALQQANR